MRKEKPKRKTSNNYWTKRALKREEEAFLSGQELNKKLLEFYENAAADVKEKILVFYHRYANENGFTFDEAVKELNKSEYREWKKSLEEYVREYETEADPVRAAELKARVDARAYRSRITRLEAVGMQIEGAVNGLYFSALNEMNKGFAEVIEKSFTGKAEDLAERFDIDMDFAEKYFSEKMVEDVISYPWCGNHFSDRLWKNKENLIFNLRDILSEGLKSGTGLPQMAKEMADRTGQSFKAAYNLVESETTHFHEEANFRAYEAAGIEKYQFWSEHELTVCGTCAALDMRVFDVKDRKEGINAPPMHLHCRCITVEYDPYEKEDYIASELEPPEDRQTWQEWYDGEVEKQGKEAVERDIKMHKNKAADEKQFEEYKNVLGKKNMPKTFADFQDLKYNDSEGWNTLKHNYRIVNSYEDNSGRMDRDLIIKLDDFAYNTKTKSFTGKAKNKANIAVMEIDGEIKIANSQVNKIADSAYINFKGNKEQIVLKKDNPEFETMLVGSHLRDMDSEAKLLEYAADIAKDGKRHTINILSEKCMCESCLGVLKQFKKKYPNIKVNAVSNKKKLAEKNHNKPWDYRKER